MQMPRGAIPSPRSEIATAERYHPEPVPELSVPSGPFPTPNHELAAAQSYRPSGAPPESFLALPARFDNANDQDPRSSLWAEEAFTKACVDPKVFVPPAAVELAARECGSSNFARFMQNRGFTVEQTAYLDGPFYAVDWTNTSALHSAIATIGPVKIGVALASLAFGSQGQITPGKSGWAVHGVAPAQPGDHCASLCGYGELSSLTDLFRQRGLSINPVQDSPGGVWYALYISGSIGILDRQSLINVTGEAWVRNPTTITRPVSG